MTIYWRGPSVLDGAPIRLALSSGSTNRKTGNAVQTWILRDDISPIEAVRSHGDASVCGACRLRHNLGGGCYVLPFQAPTAIWKAKDQEKFDPLGAKFLRMGAYGDPAAIPEDVWGNLIEWLDLPTVGYTHQWRHPRAQWLKGLVMASTHTPAETLEANRRGWAAYQTVDIENPLTVAGSMECPSGQGVQCADCLRCDATYNIHIPIHGARTNSFEQFRPER